MPGTVLFQFMLWQVRKFVAEFTNRFRFAGVFVTNSSMQFLLLLNRRISANQLAKIPFSLRQGVCLSHGARSITPC